MENPQWRRIPEEPLVLIDRLLLEKIPLAGIARVLKISEPWLQNYVNDKYDEDESIRSSTSSQEKSTGLKHLCSQQSIKSLRNLLTDQVLHNQLI